MEVCPENAELRFWGGLALVQLNERLAGLEAIQSAIADNEGLATQLAIYQTRYGDWREIFRYIDRIDKVTKADIRRVANKTFVDSNRTVAMIETTKPPAPAATTKGGE